MTEHVTKVQQHKIDALEVMKARFSESKEFIFTNYRGLTVAQITDLRERLRAKQVEYKVVKNRYARLAFEQLDKAEASGVFVGPTAIALMDSDSAAVAKLLFDYARDTPVEVKGAYVDGRFFAAAQTEALSKLPTRDQLLAQLMSTMNAPLQNLVYAMNGVTQKLVRVLQAVADQKAEQA